MLIVKIISIYALYIFLMKIWSKRYEDAMMGSVETFLFLALLIPAYPLMLVQIIFWAMLNKFKKC